MARYTYVISDIHVQFDAFMKMLDKIEFGYDDEMYILGDVIDRGPQSLVCVKWIMDIPECKIVKLNGKVFYLNHTQIASQEYFKTDLTDRMFPSYERYMKYHDLQINDYTCIYGHIPTMQMRAWHKQERSNTIWKNKDGSIIDIDCGAGFPDQGGCLGCLRLNDMKEFYVEV